MGINPGETGAPRTDDPDGLVLLLGAGRSGEEEGRRCPTSASRSAGCSGPASTYIGKQGSTYAAPYPPRAPAPWHLHAPATIQSGHRARAQMHAGHGPRSMLEGAFGGGSVNGPKSHMRVRAGELVVFPPPCRTCRRTAQPAALVIAGSDPNEQESVALLPELEAPRRATRRPMTSSSSSQFPVTPQSSVAAPRSR